MRRKGRVNTQNCINYEGLYGQMGKIAFQNTSGNVRQKYRIFRVVFFSGTGRIFSRVKGDHHIYYRDDIPEILNLQPSGNKAKPYQVKQVREVILKYHLSEDINDQV